jgi:hypothetical protein
MEGAGIGWYCQFLLEGEDKGLESDERRFEIEH